MNLWTVCEPQEVTTHAAPGMFGRASRTNICYSNQVVDGYILGKGKARSGLCAVCCLMFTFGQSACNFIDRGLREEGGIKKNKGYRALSFYISIEPHFHFKDF